MADVDTVRLLIADIDLQNQLFTDAHLQTFLDLEAANIKRAAAQALDAIASSEVLVSKVIRTQDLSTDGAKVADALRQHAASLRTQADEDDDEFAFEIVDFDPSPAWPGFGVI